MADLFDIAIARKLSDGGGGGGSSDFSTVHVTLQTVGEEGTSQSYEILMCDMDEHDTAINYQDGYLTDTAINEQVNAGESTTKEVYIYQKQGSKYVIVATGDPYEAFTVTGDAEMATWIAEWSTDPVNIVKVYGDCTISTVGRSE